MSGEDPDAPPLALLLNCTSEVVLLHSRITGKVWPIWANISALTRNESDNGTWISPDAEDLALTILSPLLDTRDGRIPQDHRTLLRDFLSDCLFPLKPRPFALHWGQKLAWTALFAAMLLVAVGGNTIVMWVVLGKYC
ncbi:hypothetical protein B566_EDAN002934 [Ephemera danica]|nr:hypothetical protein B566_EDAN002934 [Ephemera danica]